MVVTKSKNRKNKKWNISACWLVDLEEVSSLHKGWAKPRVMWSRVCRALITSMISFSVRLLFEGETLNGVVRATQREKETERETERSQDPFCWSQPLCHGWPRPPGWPGSTLEQSRTLGPAHTSCHCCLLHRPGTDTAHRTAWTTHSNSGTYNWPTIGAGAWQSDRSPTTSHSTGRLYITPVVVFVVVPLLW